MPLHTPFTTVLPTQFIEELFKPQDMYSEKATKEVFYKVSTCPLGIGFVGWFS